MLSKNSPPSILNPNNMKASSPSYLWHSTNPTQNRARWYALKVTQDLWGNRVVIRRWGRRYGSQQEAFTWLDTPQSLKQFIQKTHQRRLAHGYTRVTKTL